MICAACESRKHFECIDCMNNHKTHICTVIAAVAASIFSSSLLLLQPVAIAETSWEGKEADMTQQRSN